MILVRMASPAFDRKDSRGACAWPGPLVPELQGGAGRRLSPWNQTVAVRIWRCRRELIM
jgi:hypothetical protein